MYDYKYAITTLIKDSGDDYPCIRLDYQLWPVCMTQGICGTTVWQLSDSYKTTCQEVVKFCNKNMTVNRGIAI